MNPKNIPEKMIIRVQIALSVGIKRIKDLDELIAEVNLWSSFLILIEFVLVNVRCVVLFIERRMECFGEYNFK